MHTLSIWTMPQVQRRYQASKKGGGEMGLTKLDVDEWLIRTVCKSALLLEQMLE